MAAKRQNQAVNRSGEVKRFDNGKSFAAARLRRAFVVSSSTMNPEPPNPYAPTCTPVVTDRDATWYLSRVRTYYVWMGYGLLTYFGVGITAGSIGAISDGSLRAVAPLCVGLILWGPLFAWLVTNLLRIGHTSDEEFSAHYGKARWTGILVGAIFFPLLSIPAFISVRRLSLYRGLNTKH